MQGIKEGQLSEPVDLLQAISRFLSEGIEKEKKQKTRLKRISHRQSYSERGEERDQSGRISEKVEALGVREMFQISELRRTIAYTATKITQKLGGGLKDKETADEIRFLLLLNMNQLQSLSSILSRPGSNHRSQDGLDPSDDFGREGDTSFARNKNQSNLAMKFLQEIDLPAPSYELHPHFVGKPLKQMVTGKR
jgi:hypothetical protein